MKTIILFLGLFCAAFSFGLNLPRPTYDSLAEFERGCKFAKENGIPAVRFSTAMPDATKGSILDTYALERAGQIVSQYGLLAVVDDYTQAVNSKYFRSFWTNPAMTVDEIWTVWKTDEANGFFQDCKNPRGLYPWLWSPCAETSDKLVQAIEKGLGRAVDVRQIENEPGATLDAYNDPNSPDYGKVSPKIKEWLAYRLNRTSGNLASPPWETQTMAGLLNQIETEDRRIWGKFKYQSINLYVPYAQGESASAWAAKAVAWLKDFELNVWWPGRDLVISELGGTGMPKSLRLQAYKSFLRLKPARWRFVCWYSFNDPEWGIQ